MCSLCVVACLRTMIFSCVGDHSLYRLATRMLCSVLSAEDGFPTFTRSFPLRSAFSGLAKWEDMAGLEERDKGDEQGRMVDEQQG